MPIGLDIACEALDGAKHMVINQYRRLQELDPNHNLLRFIIHLDGSKVDNPILTLTDDLDLRKEFDENYTPTDKPREYLEIFRLGNYAERLKQTADEIGGPERPIRSCY